MSNGKEITGIYKCGLETQKYEVLNDGIRLVGETSSLTKAWMTRTL